MNLENLFKTAGSRQVSVLIILLFTLSACARHPWHESLSEEQSGRMTELVQTMQNRDQICPSTLDAEVIIAWQSPVEKRSINAYLQILQPNFLKLIVSNPLGQPLYGMAIRDNSYQVLDTGKKEHTMGNINSFALRYKLPGALFHNEQWGAWLTGRMRAGNLNISDVRTDREGRGIWLTIREEKDGILTNSHLLIEPDKQELLLRILEDSDGKTIASISYQREPKQQNSPCRQVEHIWITDLPYKTDIQITFLDILLDQPLQKDDFTLPAPRGYMTRLLP